MREQTIFLTEAKFWFLKVKNVSDFVRKTVSTANVVCHEIAAAETVPQKSFLASTSSICTDSSTKLGCTLPRYSFTFQLTFVNFLTLLPADCEQSLSSPNFSVASFPAREKTKHTTEQTMISPCFYNFEHKLYIFSRVKLRSEKTGVATQKWCIEAFFFFC